MEKPGICACAVECRRGETNECEARVGGVVGKGCEREHRISLAAYPEKIAAANFLHVNDALVYELFDQVGYRLADDSCLNQWSKRCKEFKLDKENWGSISVTAISSAR